MTFQELYSLIDERKRQMPEGSSTTRLMNAGFPLILAKFNEEAFEVGLALEHEQAEDVALEVSQSFYYLMCLSIFLGESFESLELSPSLTDDQELDKHELAKDIARHAADVCHTPCLRTINSMSQLLFKALKSANASLEMMMKTL